VCRAATGRAKVEWLSLGIVESERAEGIDRADEKADERATIPEVGGGWSMEAVQLATTLPLLIACC
jgi:hypothetical protein